MGIDSSYITGEEYQLFIDEKQAIGECHRPDSQTTERCPAGDENKPVVGVRASDAEAFCEWLTQKYAGWRVQFRLPTLAEAQTHPTPDKHIGYWCKDEDKIALGGIELDGTRTLAATLPLHRDFDHQLMRDRDLVRNLSTDCERLLSNSRASHANPLLALLKVAILLVSIVAILVALGTYFHVSEGMFFLRAFSFLFLFLESSPTEDINTPGVFGGGLADSTSSPTDPTWGAGELYMFLGMGLVLFFSVAIFKQIGQDIQSLVQAIYKPIARKLLVEKYYSLYPLLSEALKIERDFDPTIYENLSAIATQCQERNAYHKAATNLDELLKARDFWNALADFLLGISQPSKIWWFRESNRKRLKQLGYQCAVESQEIQSLYAFIVLVNKRRLGYASPVEGIRIVREKAEFI
ncbi:MAG: SUMF1/EgtB/PvdO family nonheme iron enzyme [Cyanobacteriota bacterium]|nr:SUMF1/EgtB/PvdO family nonheme iron enzyme [Cyanobacteriota bacterium]